MLIKFYPAILLYLASKTSNIDLKTECQSILWYRIYMLQSNVNYTMSCPIFSENKFIHDIFKHDWSDNILISMTLSNRFKNGCCYISLSNSFVRIETVITNVLYIYSWSSDPLNRKRLMISILGIWCLDDLYSNLFGL